ncbi:LysR substrate-binding domain-containing protein [Gilvimarinus sp. F26214L]|uniref:LysR substrate-binding domain-containing protein n=1 Tax=Gilvimarinus sp. DZF01 TaxID=3461371 RepID=UPI004045B6A5
MKHLVDRIETLGGALEDVRAFCSVVECGTLSAAAKQAGETKGGVSRRLSRLERRLGVVLLARTPRAVSVTEEGLAFYDKAREALTWLDDAAEGARQSQSVPQGRLRITAPVDLGMELLPECLVRFRKRHPQISIELMVTDTPQDLAAHRIDLALRVPAGELPDMDYRASSLVAYRIGLYASPRYLAGKDEPHTPAALPTHDLIGVDNINGAAPLYFYDRRGRIEQAFPQPVIRTTDFASALRLTLAGGGIAPLPELIAARAAASGLLVRVLSAWHLAEVTLYAISLSGRDAPARVRVFKDFLRKELTRELNESLGS